MHGEDDFFAFVRYFLDEVMDGGNVGGEGRRVGAFGTGAGEGDYGGGVFVLGGEVVQDFGEGGGSFLETGDEDEGWFGHWGWRLVEGCSGRWEFGNECGVKGMS